MGASASPLADAPLIFAGIGAITISGIALWQFYRLWQWRQGKVEDCMACRCLLAAEYQARWNWGRDCLGCQKFSKHVDPFAREFAPSANERR